MFRIGFLLAAISCVVSPLIGQVDEVTEAESGVLTQEFLVDLKLHTNGFLAVGAIYSRSTSPWVTHLYNIEVGALRHPKEQSQNSGFNANQFAVDNNAFTFGKQNYLYALRAGYGQRRYLSTRKNLAMSLTYTGGLSLGVLRPYYLYILRFPGTIAQAQASQERYTTENAADFLDINGIIGSVGGNSGWDELSFRPGLHLRSGVNLDLNPTDSFAKSLEVGMMLDYYPGDAVPIMIETNNTPLFVNVYVTLQFGKRW